MSSPEILAFRYSKEIYIPSINLVIHEDGKALCPMGDCEIAKCNFKIKELVRARAWYHDDEKSDLFSYLNQKVPYLNRIEFPANLANEILDLVNLRDRPEYQFVMDEDTESCYKRNFDRSIEEKLASYSW